MGIEIKIIQYSYVVIDTNTSGQINPRRTFFLYKDFKKWDEENPLKYGSRICYKVPFDDRKFLFVEKESGCKNERYVLE